MGFGLVNVFIALTYVPLLITIYKSLSHTPVSTVISSLVLAWLQFWSLQWWMFHSSDFPSSPHASAIETLNQLTNYIMLGLLHSLTQLLSSVKDSQLQTEL
jgi:hypothetical protein